MKTLLLVAHGSRRQQSNEEVRELCESLKEMNIEYAEISHAFLELATPSIPEGLMSLIEKGAEDIIVMPYFLAAGTHVVNDIPGIIETFQSQNPNVRISIAPYIGLGEGMKSLILEQAAKA